MHRHVNHFSDTALRVQVPQAHSIHGDGVLWEGEREEQALLRAEPATHTIGIEKGEDVWDVSNKGESDAGGWLNVPQGQVGGLGTGCCLLLLKCVAHPGP